MHPVRQLHRLQRPAFRRLMRLRLLAAAAIAESDAAVVDRTVAFTTIELQTTWSNFWRSYFLSGVRGAFLESGVRVSVRSPASSVSEGVGRAVMFQNPQARSRSDGTWLRRDEPAWHDPSLMARLFRNEGFSNIAAIDAALGLTKRTLLDLSVFRNWYAHRNEQTIRAARDRARTIYGIPGDQSPTRILLSTPLVSAGPYPLLITWADTLGFVVRYVCAG